MKIFLNRSTCILVWGRFFRGDSVTFCDIIAHTATFHKIRTWAFRATSCDLLDTPFDKVASSISQLDLCDMIVSEIFWFF